MNKLRILVADDHEIVRRGLVSLIKAQPNWEVCAEADNGRQAVELAQQLRPGVVILDIGMPTLNGLEATRQILRDNPQTRVLILTITDTDQAVRAVLDAGARGFLLKDISLELLTDAIRRVAAGETAIRPAITQHVLRGLDRMRTQTSEAPETPERLTKRELDVLRLLAGGYSNREIADALGTVEGTVKNHASSILAKLGVRDRTRAVLKALELGYL